MNIHRVSHREIAFEVAVGLGDHEMDVERLVGVVSHCLDKCRSERDVVHQVTVHDIAVYPIGPGTGDRGYFLAQAGEIAGKDRWGNNCFHGVRLR